MKFASQDDVRLFLVEVGCLGQALQPLADGFEPTEEQLQSFIKARRSVVPGVKNFRRQQSSREAWRSHRYKFMKGIKSFHRSVEGKRFHRALGRFLSTRDTSKNRHKRDAHENITDVCETLKALSSLRTHAYIAAEYWRPVNDQVDYEIFLEELLPVLDRVERSLLGEEACSSDDLDLVVALTESKAIVMELAEAFKVEPNQVAETAHGLHDQVDWERTGSYLRSLNLTKDKLTEVVRERARSTVGDDRGATA